MVYSEFVPFGEAVSAVHNPMIVACVEQVRDHYFNGDYGVASKAAEAVKSRLERLKNLNETYKECHQCYGLYIRSAGGIKKFSINLPVDWIR